MTKYEKAILDMLSYAEGTLGISNNGYDVMFTKRIIIGWTEDTDIVHGLSDWVIRANGISSSAAGRYQFLGDTWIGSWKGGDKTKKGQNVPLTKNNQDIAALYQIKRKKGVTDDELNGMEDFNTFKIVLDKIAPEWASIPKLNGDTYYKNQPARHTHEDLYDVFMKALALY